MNISTIAKIPSQRLAARLPFYYGWVMVPIAVLAAIATSPGQTFGVSIFNPYFRSYLGLNHSQLTGAYMFGTFLAALPQPLIGSLMDRFGIRRVMAAIVILFGLACLFMAQVSSLLLLFVAFFLLRLLGQGALSLLAANTLPMWFHERLGTVAGFMSAGVASSIAFIPPLILLLIKSFGWQGAYVSLGFLVWLVMLPLLFLLYRNHPQDVGQKIDGRLADQESINRPEQQPIRSFTLQEARRTRSFWILLLFTATWSMIITAIFFNIVPIFTSQGLTEANAATTYTILAVALIISQLVSGWLADRIPVNWLGSACLLFTSGGVLALSQADTVLIAQLYAILIGTGQGLFSAMNNTVWVRYFGRAHLGKIRGSISLALVAGSSAGPFIMGASYDLSGSYSLSIMFFVILMVPLAIAALWATPPKQVAVT